jgi:putative PEP-CTERM system histidine kinase
MFELILSSITALLLLAVGLYAVAKKPSAANAAIFVTLALLAGIEFLDQLSLQPFIGPATVRDISLWLEALLPLSFLLLSLFYGRSRPFESRSKVLLALASCLALFPPAVKFYAGSDLFYSPDFPGEPILFLESAGYWFYLGTMSSLVVSLASVEATLTATRGTDRYRMKFEVFGIMSLMAVLIFYYSQGLLYRTIDMSLVPVRSGVLIIAALLIGYSRMFRGTDARVAVSQHVLYRSIALLVVGVYLLALGLIGEGMRYFGVTFGRDLGIVLAFAGGVILLVVLSSEKLRTRTKAYVRRHFYASKHDYREEWIRLTDRLSSCATLADVQEAVLTAYWETFGLAGASLYLLSRDGERYVRTLEHAMPGAPEELRMSADLQQYFLERERVMNLIDGEHRLPETEQAILRKAGAWLIVPLISNRDIIGLVVLREQFVHEKLIYDDYDLMKVLARQAAQSITNLRLSEELMETREVAAVARISSFVIHDLKNLTTGLSLVVDNAQEHIGNPEFQQDAIRTIRNTLTKMKALMQRLRSIPEKSALAAGVEDIDRLSRETVTELTAQRPDAKITYEGSPAFSRVDGEEIRKVIVNIVQNALEACGQQGAVSVTARRENGGACIRVSDRGCGMTEDFVKDHLFKPFRTTKEKGLGIGLYQCKQIVEAHGGTIEVKSEAGKGTEFAVFLPAAEGEISS